MSLLAVFLSLICGQSNQTYKFTGMADALRLGGLSVDLARILMLYWIELPEWSLKCNKYCLIRGALATQLMNKLFFVC